MNNGTRNQATGTQRGRRRSVLLAATLLAGAGGARFFQPLGTAHAGIGCVINSGSVAHFTPCEGAPGTLINVMMTRAISSPPLLLQFTAVVTAGVPAQVTTPLVAKGALYQGAAPLALCINTSGSRAWQVFLVDTMRRTWGNIGTYTVDCRPGIAPNNPPPTPVATPNPAAGQPFAVLSSYVLDFGTVQVGQRSAPQTVRLTTLGTVPLQIGPSTIRGTGAGAFRLVSNGCAGTLPVRSSCTESVVFAPSAPSSFVAELYIHNAANSFVGYYVKLTGTTGFSKSQFLLPTATATATPGGSGNPGGGGNPGGTGPTPVKNPRIVPPVLIAAPEAIVSPTHLDFGDQDLHTPSGAQSVTLTNTGNAALAFTGNTAIAGDNAFTIQSDTCSGQIISVGSACTVAVIFTPTDPMDYSASLTFSDNSPGHRQLVALTGHGHAAATTFSTDPTTLSFGQVDTGTTSEARTVTVTNNGPEQISFGTDPSLGGEGASAFSIAKDDCAGKTLNDGETCTLSLSFAPPSELTAATEYNATLEFNPDGANGPESVSLNGTGTPVTAPAARLSASSLDFGQVDPGTTSAPQAVTLTNSGTGALTLDSDPAISGDGFAIASSTCTGSLAAGASCDVAVTFTPGAAGETYAGSLTFTDDAPGGVQSTSLSGSGTPTVDNGGSGSGSGGSDNGSGGSGDNGSGGSGDGSNG